LLNHCCIIAAVVRTSDNVFDLMRHRAVLLAKLAVPATIPCPAPDKKPPSAHPPSISKPDEMPLGLEPED